MDVGSLCPHKFPTIYLMIMLIDSYFSFDVQSLLEIVSFFVSGSAWHKESRLADMNVAFILPWKSIHCITRCMASQLLIQ